MSRNYKRDQSGFTIIETLIVLAVAGMIMLIIFMALPTLQRNSRNNARKQDVAAVLDAVSRWGLNNSGEVPAHIDSDGTGKIDYLEYTTLHYYEEDNIEIASVNLDEAQSATEPEASIENITIFNRRKCDPDNRGRFTAIGAGYNDVVALYALETSGGTPLAMCQEM